MPGPSSYGMFATGCAMAASTMLRTSAACVKVWSERGPSLMEAGLKSWEDSPDAPRAQGEFRDELIAMAQASTDAVVRELQRGMVDLDTFTRPDDGFAEEPSRPFKQKR